MRPLPLFSLTLLLLLPAAAARAYDGEQYQETYQETPVEENYPQESYPEETYPEQSYPDPGYPEEQYPDQPVPDQTMPMEEPSMEQPDYSPEQAPEYQQHMMEIRRSCEESANDAQMQMEEREQFIQDCLQSQGLQ